MRETVADALAILSPTECCGCGAPDRGVCEACRLQLAPKPARRILDGDLDPLIAWSALDYCGVVRSVFLAYKEKGRTDAARALAPAARAAVTAALAGASIAEGHDSARVALAVIPSTRESFRRRGYHPTALALGHAGFRVSRVLSAARQTEDQAGLGYAERAWNRDGSLRAGRSACGARYLIVDDILTTGATVREARRALEQAGGNVLGVAIIAVTRRLGGAAEDPHKGAW